MIAKVEKISRNDLFDMADHEKMASKKGMRNGFDLLGIQWMNGKD